MTHLMLDLESMGTRPNAPIISIGAVKFDPSTGSLGQEFYRQIDLESACKFGVPSGSTIKWWLQQGEDARKAASEGNYQLAKALEDLAGLYRDWRDVQVWANDPDFDCVILEYAYFKTGSSHPWAFWNKRSCRTIAELAGKRPPKHQGVAHNALEDAKHQARWVSDFWQQIKGVKKAEVIAVAAAGSPGDPLDDL